LERRGGPRQLIDTPEAAANREKAVRHYQKKLKNDREKTLEQGRQHQKNLREQRQWTPVQVLVNNAIKAVLEPYKEHDRAVRRAAYEERNRLARNLRQRLRQALKRAEAKKSDHTLSLVGCTMAEYNAHMQSQLPAGTSMRGMSCDHIFPLSRYDLTSPAQQRMANHFSNLQPMRQGGKDGNSSKSNKLPSKSMALKVEEWAWPSGVTMDMLPDG
tara:strand:- start:4141 stop:4785 length:645 start_codon:yes stop_codon:yes gene_type:complete